MASSWPKKHLWEYKTDPSHPFDYSLWFILRPLMLLKAHGKISHWWHWNKIQSSRVKNQNLKGTRIKGDNSATFSRQSTISKIKVSLGGWKRGFILTPKTTPWQYGFKGDTEGYMERCAVILEGPIIALSGPEDFSAYAFKVNSFEEIPLEVSDYVFRDDQTIPWPIV